MEVKFTTGFITTQVFNDAETFWINETLWIKESLKDLKDIGNYKQLECTVCIV